MITNGSYPAVYLKCGNLRIAFTAFTLLFIMLSLAFLCLMMTNSINPHFAKMANSIGDYFGSHAAAFMTGPIIVLSTLLYFNYSRIKLTCYNNQILMEDVPVQLAGYQLKEIFNGVTFIYLQTTNRLWIIYPTTSQDGRKLPDTAIMRREAAANNEQVKLLAEKLAASGAVQKRFWFFTKDVVIAFGLFIMMLIIVLLNL